MTRWPSPEVAPHDGPLIAGHQVLLGRDLPGLLRLRGLDGGARRHARVGPDLVLGTVGRPDPRARAELLRHFDHLAGVRQSTRWIADAIAGASPRADAALLARVGARRRHAALRPGHLTRALLRL